jgi:hypothetical protein
MVSPAQANFSFEQLVAAFGSLAVALTTAVPALAEVTGGLAVLLATDPIGWAIDAAAAIGVLAYEIYWDQMPDWWRNIVRGFESGPSFSRAWKSFECSMTALWRGVTAAVKAYTDAIGGCRSRWSAWR